jgi:iron complex outermembrane receptor protein
LYHFDSNVIDSAPIFCDRTKNIMPILNFKLSFLILSLGLSSFALAAQQPADIERIEVHYRQAYRGDLPAQSLPQSISVIDKSLLQDNALTRFQDALDFSASISRQNNGGGLWDSFSLRGFPGNENMPSGYLINGFNGGRGFSGHRDLSNVEYVEILKGPGSALYGRSEPGGTINVVTRKPQKEQEGYLQVSTGRFDQHRVEADYTNGISDNIAVRINGAVQDYGSFRDYVSSKKQVFTPSIRIELSDKSVLLYEFEHMKQEQLFDRGIVVLNGDFHTVPRSRYLGEPGDGPTEIEATGHQFSYETSLTDHWSFLAGLGYRDSSLSGFSSDAELAKARQSLFDDGETLTRQRRYRDYQAEDRSVRFELSGHLITAGVVHHLLMGADAYDYDLYTLLSRFRGPKGTYALDIFNPVYGSTATAPAPLYENKESQKAWGMYLQDQMDLTPHWKLLLGLRFDDYQQDIQELLKATRSDKSGTQVSPRIGLVYEVNPELSFYSSYSEGFLPLSGTDYAGNPFEPELSDSYEIGAKFTTSGITGTLALFDAKKSNILTSDPVNVGFAATLGEAASRGIELDLQGQLTEQLSAQLSYAFLDTQTTTDMINIDWGVNVPAGSRLVNIPKHNTSLMLTQLLPLGSVESRLGMKVNHVAKRLGDSVDSSYTLPSHTLVGLSWAADLDQNWKAQLNVDNLFDKFYIHNSYSALWTVPGEPRSYRLSLTYAF